MTCPTLSGRYVIQGEDGRVYVTIVQPGCDRIHIEWNYSLESDPRSSKHDLALDDQFRKDVNWFGFRDSVVTSERFRDGKLEIIGKSTALSKPPKILWTLVLELLPDGDLCTRSQSGSTPWGAMRAGRWQATDYTEKQAAARSEKGCG